MGRRLGKGVIALHDLRKGEDGQLRHTQRDIEIPEADVRVDTQNPFPLRCKAGCDRGTDGGFPRAALAGNHTDRFSHCAWLLSDQFYPMVIC